MHTIKNSGLATLVLVLLTLSWGAANSHAFGWGGDQELVTINETSLLPDDYLNWWREWRDPDTQVPETPDEFIDWMLLYQEAKDSQLDENPAYLKKVSVFLKVRALMMLKQEEVDARKEMPGRDALWAAYLKKYTPIFDLRLLSVDTEEKAAVIGRFIEEGLPLAEAAASAGLEEQAEQMASTGEMRAKRLPEPLREVALGLGEGQVGGPVAYSHNWYFFEVLARNDGTEEDFEKNKADLVRKDLKRQENRLTSDLVERLKKKFAVEVDEALLVAITPEGVPAEDAGKTLIRFGDEMNVTAGDLYPAILKAYELRSGAARNPEDFEASRKRVVADAMVQTLTSMEALERHYETVPPFKYTYDFYRQHRMIKELEKAAILPRVKVSDEDVEAHYRDNGSLYSREGLFELAVVNTNEAELAATLEKRLQAGEEFFAVMAAISPAGIETEKTAYADLEPAIRDAVTRMSPGQSSGGIVDGEETYFVKLIRIGEKEPIPLKRVAGQIRTRLEKEGFEAARGGILEQLRQRSTIEVDDRSWKKLKERLLEEEKGNNES